MRHLRQNDFFSHLRRQLLFRRPQSLLHLVQQHLEGGGSQLGRHLRPLLGLSLEKLFSAPMTPQKIVVFAPGQAFTG
jgi:hypothetical protein